MAEIGIIIPAYNVQDYLAQTIDSVLQQTFADWSLIIIDDGSVDATRAIAEKYAECDPRIRLYTQPNAGVAVARNAGLARLSTEERYVLFLDHDDCLVDTALDTLHRALAQAPNAPTAYGLPRSIDSKGNILTKNLADAFGYRRYQVAGRRLARVEAGKGTGFASFVIWSCIETPGQVLIRRSVLASSGPFDQATAPSDDWDLWLRLSLLGDFVYLPAFTLNKRDHVASVSKKGKIMGKAEPVIRRKLATSALFSPEQRRIARWGHFYSCYFRLLSATIPLKERRYTDSARLVYVALRSYARFFYTFIRPL